MRARILGCLAAAMLAAVPARAQDAADSAWARGDQAAARRLYAERIARDSSDTQALYRLALLTSWDRRYDEGIALFDRLLRVAPDRDDARLDRARVLSWARRFDVSVTAYQDLLQRRPGDKAALLGLAQVLSWSGHYDSSLVVYGALAQRDSADLEPERGRARVTSWQGQLGSAEDLWRALLVRDSTDLASLLGLSAVLRWQGRPDAAHETLARVPAEQRDGAEYVEERDWVDAARAPGGSPTVTYETDSDENRIFTLSLRGRAPVRPRFQVGGDVYLRRATYDPVVTGVRRAWGVTGIGRWLTEPGWVVTGGLGLAGGNGAASSTVPTVLLAGSSPVRDRLAGSVTLQHVPFDAVALSIERGVTMTDLAAGGRYLLDTRWTLEGGLSTGWFQGTASNHRTGGFASATRTLTPRWSVAGTLRAFGFSKNLDDGYFDPSRYLLAEAAGRWRRLRGPWELAVEAAPGLQQVDRGGDVQLTARLGGRAVWQPGPGRLLAASATFTNAFQAIATGATGYRYLGISVWGSWAL